KKCWLKSPPLCKTPTTLSSVKSLLAPPGNPAPQEAEASSGEVISQDRGINNSKNETRILLPRNARPNRPWSPRSIRLEGNKVFPWHGCDRQIHRRKGHN